MINSNEKDNLLHLPQQWWIEARDWFEFITRTIWSNEKNLAWSESVLLWFRIFYGGKKFIPSTWITKSKEEKRNCLTEKVESLLLLCKQSVTNIWIHLFTSLILRLALFRLENCYFPVRHKLFTKDNFLLKDGKLFTMFLVATNERTLEGWK